MTKRTIQEILDEAERIETARRDKFDCGDSSCMFITRNERKGMRTNGGCRCMSERGSGISPGQRQASAAALHTLPALASWAREVREVLRCIDNARSISDITDTQRLARRLLDQEVGR